jgi:hypothetical protein
MPEENSHKENSDNEFDHPFIEITIDKKGNLVVETKGTVGHQCDLLSGQLEANLGKTVARKNKEIYGHDKA